MAETAETPDAAPPRLPRVHDGLDVARFSWLTVALVMAAHVVLGVLAERSSLPIPTVHAIVSVTLFGWFLLTSQRADVLVSCAAYLTGAEVFWRMTGVPLPWEVAKYGVAGICLVGLIRIVGRRVRKVQVPIVYLALLVPSVLVTLDRFGLAGGWERISFNVMAHVALGFAVMFLANLATDKAAMSSVLWMLLAPILAVNAIATSGTVGLGAVDFSAGLSNARASGGYGPNQVSALIGLALLACVFLVLFEHRWQLQVVAGVLGVWFAAQGALTFSRGGLFNVVFAMLFAAPFFLRTARHAARFLGAAVVLALALVVVFIPVINGITGNAFEERFASRSTTSRGDLAADEVAEFADNPGFGTGVGMSRRSNSFSDAQVASHTEFSRLLAEHGILGMFVIGLLVVMMVRAVRSQPGQMGKAFSAACAGWALAEMSHSATRLAAVAFVFALGQVVLRERPVLQTTVAGPARPMTRAPTRIGRSTPRD